MKKKGIVIVDDHEFFRKGVALTINRFSYAEVIGEAANGKELIQLLDGIKPDIILMDIKMPIMNGIDATKSVLKMYPSIKIIALSMFGEEEYLQSMLDAGVQGFLLKNIEKEGLDHALQNICNGKQYFSEELLPYFTNKYLNKGENDDVVKLTKRETEILKLIAKGLSNIEISELLHISLRTVTNHRANLNQKTGSKNTVNLLTYALRNNLIKM